MRFVEIWFWIQFDKLGKETGEELYQFASFLLTELLRNNLDGQKRATFFDSFEMEQAFAATDNACSLEIQTLECVPELGQSERAKEGAFLRVSSSPFTLVN